VKRKVIMSQTFDCAQVIMTSESNHIGLLREKEIIVMAKKITMDNFEQEVMKADKPVLLDFWASWCGPCQMLGPVIEELAEELKDVAIVGKVNVDEEKDLAKKYHVMSIPTVVVIKDGQLVDRSVGVKSKEELKAMIK